MTQSYPPSDTVRLMHEVLHLDSWLRKVDYPFDMRTGLAWNDYVSSLLPIPLLFMSAGLTAVIVCHIFLWRSHKSLPDKPLTSGHNSPRASKTPMWKYFIAITVSCAAVLIFDQSVFVGNDHISTGVLTVNRRLELLESTFATLNTHGKHLESQGHQLMADFKTAHDRGNDCTASEMFLSHMREYFSHVEVYHSHSSSLLSTCWDAQDAVHKYSVDYKNNIVSGMYVLFVVCLVGWLCGMLHRDDKITTMASSCVISAALIVAIIACGGILALLMLLADFCMDPSKNLLTVTPQSIQHVTSYYTTCAGEDPLLLSVRSAERLVTTPCTGDADFQQALLGVNAVDNALHYMHDSAGCGYIQENVLTVLNDGVCGDVYQGVWYLWLCMVACTVIIFAVTVVTAYVIPHIPSKQSVVKADINGVHTSRAPHELDCPQPDVAQLQRRPKTD